MTSPAPTTWPCDHDLAAQRWAITLLAHLTAELTALSDTHHTLDRLRQTDPLPPPDTIADTLRYIISTISSTISPLPILALAQHHHPETHLLLRHAYTRRTELLRDLRHALTPDLLITTLGPLSIPTPKLPALLDDTHTRISHIATTLTRADTLLTHQLAPNPDPDTGHSPNHHRAAYIDTDSLQALDHAITTLAPHRGATPNPDTGHYHHHDHLHLLASLILHAQTELYFLIQHIHNDDESWLTPHDIDHILNTARPDPTSWPH